MRVNLLRYAGVYIALAFGLAGLTWAAAALLGVRLPAGLSSAVPPMIAAMVEGRGLARVRRAPVPGGEAWCIAAKMTAVATVLNLALFAGLALLNPGLIAPQAIVIIGGVALVLLGVVFLINRAFLAIGAGNQLKSLKAVE